MSVPPGKFDLGARHTEQAADLADDLLGPVFALSVARLDLDRLVEPQLLVSGAHQPWVLAEPIWLLTKELPGGDVPSRRSTSAHWATVTGQRRMAECRIAHRSERVGVGPVGERRQSSTVPLRVVLQYGW